MIMLLVLRVGTSTGTGTGSGLRGPGPPVTGSESGSDLHIVPVRIPGPAWCADDPRRDRGWGSHAPDLPGIGDGGPTP
jgi:hypothetical protein